MKLKKVKHRIHEAGKEFKKQSLAVITAITFLIALVWRDAILEP